MSVYRNITPLVLASSSPRRQELLGSLGIKFRVLGSPDEEPGPIVNEAPELYVQRAAKAKGESVQRMLTGKVAKLRSSGQLPAESEGKSWGILSADTVVVFDGQILGKPRDAVHALEMLEKLSGNTHTVFTGCHIICGGTAQFEKSFVVSSKVTMWDCPKSALQAYAVTSEPLDKAGAYAIQGAGGFLVSSIEGSWSNVIGLPLSEVVQRLVEYEIIENS